MDEAVIVALRLSKAGYGKPSDVLSERTDLVIAMIAYEKFTQEYGDTFLELNREQK